MAKAHAGTDTHYGQRSFTVTDHGYEQLRNRLNELGCADMNAEPDESLWNRMDRAYKRAIAEKRIERYEDHSLDGSQPKEHVTFSMACEFRDTDLWPVLRNGKVLTVLTRQQVQRSVDGKKWISLDGVVSGPLAKLKSLTGVVPAGPPPAEEPFVPKYIVGDAEGLRVFSDRDEALATAGTVADAGGSPRLFVEVPLRFRRKVVVEIG